ncbi:heat shock 70 kDa protein 12A-like [Mytilus californianus]|uniref:heat shock 70 kDa protein 12A-like n=1 Tax=Mytilus californianus TaxID=6549 RepID=UPI002245A141|nr:heat shock 70 kDa protein 12A-like [Mytilus californianus]
MSLSKSLPKGQVQIPCELCEVCFQIQWKCLDCKLFMCSKCKERIHPKIKLADKHKIVTLKDITSDDLEAKPDLTSISCIVHDGKLCCLYCKDCEDAICSLCVTKTHTTHNMIELSEGYNMCIEKNKSYSEMINKTIETFNIDLSKLKTIELSEITRYQDGKKKVMMQERYLINSIQSQSQILSNEFEKHWNIFQDVISKEETTLEHNVAQTKTRRKIFDAAASSSDANEAFRAAREGKQMINEESVRSYIDIQRPPTFVPHLVSSTTITSVHGSLEFQDRHKRPEVVVIKIHPNKIRAAHCLKSDYEDFVSNFVLRLCVHTCTTDDKPSVDVVLKPNGKVHCFNLEDKLEFEEKRSDIFTNWYYFENIWKILFEKQDELTKDTLLTESRNDVGGTSKKMKALDVYAAVISYINKTCFKCMLHRKKFYMDDIFLVLTVPHICGTQVEQFIRDAATKANFSNEQFTITTEPDALAVYCEYMYGNLQREGRGTHRDIGCKYLIFDEGDGTTDITVHEVTWPRIVKEIYRGTRWQRNSIIVEEFCSFLNQLFGFDVISILKEQKNIDYIEFVRRFEMRIESFSQNSTRIVYVWIPVVHLQPLTTVPLEELIRKSSYNKNVGLLSDKLRITASFFRSFFESGIRYASGILDSFIPAINKEITRVFVVHDCSLSPILTDVIKQKLGPTVDVIILKSNTAVMEGASLCGFQ